MVLASRASPGGGVGRAALAAALIAISLGSIAGYGSAAESSTAEYLLDLYETTRAKLLELVNVSASANASSNVSAGACARLAVLVNASISKGDELAEEARAALEAGNEREAAVLAMRAINSLTSAFVHVTACLGATGIWPGNETNQSAGPVRPPPGLMAAITRHEVRLARLESAAEAAEASGMNVSEALDLLQEASDLLEEARAAALAGDVKNATEAMSAANQLMGRVASILRAASARAFENRLRGICGQGNCTVSVLNLTKVTPGLQRAMEKVRRAVGPSVNLTFAPPGHHRGRGLGRWGNETWAPPGHSKRGRGEKPGHGPEVPPGREEEHPGRGRGHGENRSPPGRGG